MIEVGPSQEGMGLAVLPIQAGGLGVIAIAIHIVGWQEVVAPIEGVALVTLHLQPGDVIRAALRVELVATRGSDIVHTTDEAVGIGHVIGGAGRFADASCATVNGVVGCASGKEHHLARVLAVATGEIAFHAYVVGTREEQRHHCHCQCQGMKYVGLEFQGLIVE